MFSFHDSIYTRGLCVNESDDLSFHYLHLTDQPQAIAFLIDVAVVG